ncbi:MAG: flagellar hook-associated protein FlgK [Planctomycetota bacterium]|jgi:flagellar hook-associated protein 1 FlgK
MQNFYIGLSGLDAALRALDVVGNNIANATTEGYHRQRVDLTPAYSSQIGAVLLGGGVEIAGITRMIDTLLEREILRQQSSLEQTSQELHTLRTVENAFGELSTGTGLNALMDNFFSALKELSAHPGEAIWQNQVVSAAEAMATQFRALGEYFTDLETQIALEVNNIVEQINTLTSQIAECNSNIERMEISGAVPNNLCDRRDEYITKLSQYVSVETVSRDYGVIDVAVGGIPVVVGSLATELEAGLNNSGALGITVKGASNYSAAIQGGRLGGLLSLKNDILVDIHGDLDDLAAALIEQINQYHGEGVGSAGSFTTLTGRPMASETLADFDPPVSNGSIYIRLTNTSTGAVTRNEITIDTSTDTLTTIATDISAITGLSASVNASKLSITADAGYEFDFLPAVLATPTASTLTGGSPPTISVSGIYSGTANDTFRFTVSGAGTVGNGTLQLEVRDGGGAGGVVATVNIGAGYAAGDLIEVGNGIRIAVGTGDFGGGDNFDVDAFADADTTGVLSAIGINTFFSGNNASDIAVCSEIAAAPGRIATALGPDKTDNANALRLAALEDQTVSTLNSVTPGEFYRLMVTDIGQDLSLRQIREDNVEAILLNLTNQQAEVSGVDINEEAAQMLVFEKAFQAMAKYLNTVRLSMEAIMEII